MPQITSPDAETKLEAKDKVDQPDMALFVYRCTLVGGCSGFCMEERWD